jgi:hypothetical protein
VAGGHGIIESVAHLRVPGENATEDEVTAYLDTLKTYFGSRAVNGRIGTLWPGRIREAYDLVVRDARYPEQAHHLWTVNIKLDAVAE